MCKNWIVIWFDLNEEKFRETVNAVDKSQARMIACQSHPERNNLQISIMSEEEA